MLVAGMYRLFTYVPWDAIPEEHKEFFDDEAKKVWDKDLDQFTSENIELDIKAEIHAILKVLVKRNITHSLGLIPIVLADAYVYGVGIGPLQGKLIKIVEDYKDYVGIDRDLAEQYAVLTTIDYIKELVGKIGIELDFDIDEVTKELMDKYEKATEKQKQMAARQIQLDAAANKALAKDKKETSDEDKETNDEGDN